MEEMEQAINAATSPAVQMWMNWMFVIFATSIAFAWKYKTARIVLVAFIVNLPVAMLVFSLTNSVHLIGIAHLLIWGPLAVYIVISDLKSSSFKPASLYGVWIILLLGTIVVSLIFDVRDITLVLLGTK